MVTNDDAPRGIRNNNPGNIEDLPQNKWQGLAASHERVGKQIDEDRFCVFIDPMYGIRALAILLQNYQSRNKLTNIKQIVEKYAPSRDNNNTVAYAAAVAAAVGVSTTTTVAMKDYATIRATIVAIVEHENGVACPYDDRTLDRGIAASGVNMPGEPAQFKENRVSKEKVGGTTIVGGTGAVVAIEVAKDYLTQEVGIPTETVDALQDGVIRTIEVIKPSVIEAANNLPWYQTMTWLEWGQLGVMALVLFAAVDVILDRRLTRKLGIR